MTQINVRYYAILREQAGMTHQSVDTPAHTADALFTELSAAHGFTVPRNLMKVAINGEFCDFSRVLNAHDEVVFIPPVAGG